MPDEWEYGFYDSEPERADPIIWWYCFGLPFTSAEQADHTGRKSTWGRPVIVRRRPGATEWEHVKEPGGSE